MDDMAAEYTFYWEKRMLWELEELESWGAISGSFYASSSPEAATSTVAKNNSTERNRRKKLNDRLYALRSVVPNITKMDKASIIKDAIDYIQQLKEEHSRIEAEIAQLETAKKEKYWSGELNGDDLCDARRKKKKTAMSSSSIAVNELRVSEMGEKTMVISITCSKKRDTMIRLCELFESLNLKIITANITSVSGSLLHSLFVESDKMDSAQLKEKIEAAIAELDAPRSPSSSMSSE